LGDETRRVKTTTAVEHDGDQGRNYFGRGSVDLLGSSYEKERPRPDLVVSWRKELPADEYLQRRKHEATFACLRIWGGGRCPSIREKRVGALLMGRDKRTTGCKKNDLFAMKVQGGLLLRNAEQGRKSSWGGRGKWEQGCLPVVRSKRGDHSFRFPGSYLDSSGKGGKGGAVRLSLGS